MDVTNGTAPGVPEVVPLYQEDLTPRFTPRELALIKSTTGLTFSQMMADEESDEKFTAWAWLKLRRQGFAVSWEDMQDVLIELRASEVSDVDPLNAARPTTSPLSAVTGE
jgi:hypothetical protein